MPSVLDEKEKQLYREANARCSTRCSQFRDMDIESGVSFNEGLREAFGMLRPEEQQRLREGITSESNQAFAVIAGILAKIECKKGIQYKASWQKRGTHGVLSQIERKFDRIFNVMNDSLEENSTGEILTTTLGDLAVYCIKEISRRKEMFPEEFDKWVKEAQEL